jgi:hypothetical protein
MFKQLVSYGPWADVMTATQAGDILSSVVASRYNDANAEVVQRLGQEVSLHGDATVNQIVPELRSIAANASIALQSATNLIGSVGNNWSNP